MSLASSANVLRVFDEQGVRVRALPRLSGVSKEAINMAMGVLQERRRAIVEQDSFGSRFKVARLTLHGLEAREAYHQLVAAIERHWRERYGEQIITRLCDVLERIVGVPSAGSPLFEGLEPYPGGWRASVPRPETLPHYPMVLHRGGFPDGA
ncbi:MAG TPA: hypothetical protein VGP82_22180 [Ktedonobacterales bacterium]|jgi:hypothetical protein|nr:hypothetical protein [Ktedonobacterales bacterium]